MAPFTHLKTYSRKPLLQNSRAPVEEAFDALLASNLSKRKIFTDYEDQHKRNRRRGVKIKELPPIDGNHLLEESIIAPWKDDTFDKLLKETDDVAMTKSFKHSKSYKSLSNSTSPYQTRSFVKRSTDSKESFQKSKERTLEKPVYESLLIERVPPFDYKKRELTLTSLSLTRSNHSFKKEIDATDISYDNLFTARFREKVPSQFLIASTPNLISSTPRKYSFINNTFSPIKCSAMLKSYEEIHSWTTFPSFEIQPATLKVRHQKKEKHIQKNNIKNGFIKRPKNIKREQKVCKFEKVLLKTKVPKKVQGVSTKKGKARKSDIKVRKRIKPLSISASSIENPFKGFVSSEIEDLNTTSKVIDDLEISLNYMESRKHDVKNAVVILKRLKLDDIKKFLPIQSFNKISHYNASLSSVSSRKSINDKPTATHSISYTDIDNTPHSLKTSSCRRRLRSRSRNWSVSEDSEEHCQNSPGKHKSEMLASVELFNSDTKHELMVDNHISDIIANSVIEDVGVQNKLLVNNYECTLASIITVSSMNSSSQLEVLNLSDNVNIKIVNNTDLDLFSNSCNIINYNENEKTGVDNNNICTFEEISGDLLNANYDETSDRMTNDSFISTEATEEVNRKLKKSFKKYVKHDEQSRSCNSSMEEHNYSKCNYYYADEVVVLTSSDDETEDEEQDSDFKTEEEPVAKTALSSNEKTNVIHTPHTAIFDSTNSDTSLYDLSDSDNVNEDVVDLSEFFKETEMEPPREFEAFQPLKRPTLQLKAGKSWRRSLMTYRKSIAVMDLTVCSSSRGGICTCSRCGEQDMSVYRPSNRRFSVRIISETPIKENPSSSTDFVTYATFNAATAYGQNKSIYPQKCNRESILVTTNSVHEAQPIISPPVTAREIVLRRCGQVEPLQFLKCYPNASLKNCFKIGEGVYGEVFLFKAPEGPSRVMKVIPIEGEQMVNGEHQKKFDEILSEIVIAMELSNLRSNKENLTDCFSKVENIRCVQGRYPDRLLELWELYHEDKGSENDSPELFRDNQLFIVLELAYCGQDMEAFIFNSASQALFVFKQAACALAVAETALQFEHRDLHWGNILISKTEDKLLTYSVNGHEIEVPSNGLHVSIIDFTLSRITYNGVCIFHDLSTDPDLFTATGDYQFDIYRLMQKRNNNEWQHFEPYTNVLWLHYVLDKMITALRYKRTASKVHKDGLVHLTQLKNTILKYPSVRNMVESNFLFS